MHAPAIPRLLTLSLLLSACGDSGSATDASAGTSTGADTGTPATTEPVTPTSSGPEPTTATTGTVDPPTTDATTSSTTDAGSSTGPIVPGTTTDPSTTTADDTTGTTSTGDATTVETTVDTTDDTSSTGDSGEPPPVAPELTCPGDPGCDEVPGAPLQAGVAVRSILPKCFESWIDSNNNAVYDKAVDVVLDCGCDRLCPGDANYPGKDAGEGDLTLQPIYMAGFQNNRPAMGVRGADKGLVGADDGLSARAVVLHQGETTVAIVTLDLIGYFNDEVLALRESLQQAGVEVDYLLIHSIHNHEGPDTMGLWGPQDLVSGYDPAYGAQVRATIVEAVTAASDDLRNVAVIRVGEVDISTYHENGVANVIRDSRDPWVVDEMLGAAQIVDGEDQTIATLVNFGSHPETVADKSHLLTADFVHGLRRTVEQGSKWKQAPGKPGLGGPCLFLNGAVGGLMTPLGVTVVNPDGDSYKSASFDKADSIGQLLGEMALDAVALGDVVEGAQLDVQAQGFFSKIDNDLYKLMFEAGIFTREVVDLEGGQFILTEMSVINLGPLQLLSVPGELLPELAIGGYDGSHINAPGVPLIKPANENPPAVDEAPPGPYLKDRMFGTYRWIVGLGNDELGYIVPNYDYKLDEDAPFFVEAPGDHYEETNSLGPDIAGQVDNFAAMLLDWSKWNQGK